MIMNCISDTHGDFPKLEGGDLLIIAGDLHARESWGAYLDFQTWLNEQEYREVIIVAGNHDTLIQDSDVVDDLLYEHTYLCDSGTEFEGLKLWGSPWTTRFEGMNPHCMAFTVDTDEELAEKWKLIPDDIDILITHSPPYGIFDETSRGELVGSKSLLVRVAEIKPKLHVFGHIHEDGGKEVLISWGRGTRFVNASYVNERYEPVNKSIRIEI